VSLEDRSERVDRTLPRLLSAQVADDLRAQITAGSLTGRLPAEHEMADQYGVSRITTRRAIAILAAEGLVTTLHGRGSFVVRDLPSRA
jgi:DNA-binding GntR family transcriptional regulator